MHPVVSGLRALHAISRTQHGITLQHLSEQLEIPVDSASGILAVLLREQFVVRSGTGHRYLLGPAAVALGHGGEEPTEAPPAHPDLSRLAVRWQEAVFLCELHGDRVICVSAVDPHHRPWLSARTGSEVPLHAAASARVLLAELPEPLAEALLSGRPLPAYTEHTPVTAAEVLSHLPLIRARGYDICDEEFDPGVWTVAAPIRDQNGTVCAALAVAAPVTRVRDAEVRSRWVATVVASAEQFVVGPGHTPPPAVPPEV